MALIRNGQFQVVLTLSKYYAINVEFTMASLARITQELDVTVSVIATGELG